MLASCAGAGEDAGVLAPLRGVLERGVVGCEEEEDVALRRGEGGAVIAGEPRGVVSGVMLSLRGELRGDTSSRGEVNGESRPRRGDTAGEDHPEASSSHPFSKMSADFR